MASLLGSRDAVQRDSIIKSIAEDTALFLDPKMIREGRLVFPQEGHVAMARKPS